MVIFPSIRELLYRTGQYEPPVKLVPIIQEMGKSWQYEPGLNYPRTDGKTIFVPDRVRASQPDVNIAIAHDLYQALLGIPGRATDLAYDERESEFDAWGRSMVMPEHWFREDAERFRRQRTVRTLAKRYNVFPRTIVTRALELTLCTVVCRDAESYRFFMAHPYWKDRRIAYLTTHRRCEHARCDNKAVMVHHLDPAGYKFIGREEDEHLRALCKPHHDAQHPAAGQLTFL